MKKILYVFAAAVLALSSCTKGADIVGGYDYYEYTLGGQAIFVHGIECRLADGTIAGSMLTLERAVKNMWDYSGLPLHEAVNLASRNPARVLGIEDRKGTLEPGRDADIAIIDRDFAVQQTIVEGRTVFRR